MCINHKRIFQYWKKCISRKKSRQGKKILLWISFQALCAWSRDPQFPWAPNEALAKAQITSSISALGVHFFLDILIWQLRKLYVFEDIMREKWKNSAFSALIVLLSILPQGTSDSGKTNQNALAKVKTLWMHRPVNLQKINGLSTFLRLKMKKKFIENKCTTAAN